MLKTGIAIITIFGLIFGCGKDSGYNSSGSYSPGSGTGGTGKAGSLARFAIVGNYLYALDENDLVCYDISAPNNPVLKKRQNVGFRIETIYPYQDKLFIGAQTAMYAYSIADPASPQLISMVSHVRACDPVVVQGNYAYVTLRSGTVCGGSNTLNVYNVSNSAAPQLLKTISIPSPVGLGIQGNALYVTTTGGIRLFNISVPDNPVAVADIAENGATDVIPYNNTLIVQLAAGAAFYDISNELSPVFQSRINQ
ncbi:MAG TPA: hypothetical protein VF145_02325 [Chitinophagaceae bacterium]